MNTGADVYILKLDGTGSVLWNRSYGGSQTDVANFAFFDTRDSSIVVIGTTSSNDYMVTGYHTSPDEGDIWVMKVNKAGNLLWQKTLGSIQEEKGTGICARREGGYIVYGTTKPYNCHDSTLGDIGAVDCWLFALDNSGNTITDKIFGGTTFEETHSVIPYLNGYVATGASASTVFTEGTCNINISGAFVSYIDYWPLGLSNISTSGDFMTVFPNPAKESIKVNISSVQSGNIKILNNMGQTVLEEPVNSPSTQLQINVREWISGVYCVVWQGRSGEMITSKFIKE